MKKNILAAALVAGLGLAGAAAAYNYGTVTRGTAATTGDTSNTVPAGIAIPEPVSYEMLVAGNFNWTMQEDLIFDIQIPDNAVQFTDGFTVRIALNSRCAPHDTATNPVSPPTNIRTCGATGDGAAFNTANIPVSGTGPGQLELNAALVLAGWQVQFDGYSDNGTIASIRIIPAPGNNANPGPGELLRWHNAQLTSLNEFAATAFAGTAKVDAEFWMVNPNNDARFVNSTMSRTILESRRGVVACATPNPAEVDKYIDVADNWNERQIPKTRFSWDGKLGSADDASTVAAFQLPLGSNYNAQVIDLGDVTLGTGAVTGSGTFTYWGNGNAFNGVADVFSTVIEAGAGNNWAAFDNAGIDDDVFLVNGTCSSGVIIDRGTVSGSTVTFIYNAQEIENAQAGFINLGGVSRALTVCGYVDTNTIIDDHNNAVSTTFYRVGMFPNNTSAPGDTGTGYPTSGYTSGVGSRVLSDASCVLLPLRYNGSTMEIFTINPGSNTTQRSFVRLTNRGATSGYVSLEGIDNAGNRGASQVRVWVPAGASVQLDARDLENGTNGAIGAWGTTPVGKWRAVVTAEFPGLVASSLVNSSLPSVLTNITDSDTRGEQYDRDYNEGTFASTPGERPSDYVQEVTPDFDGNGRFDTTPGGPDGGYTDTNGNGRFDPGESTPTGGDTKPDGNPGLP